MNDRRLIDEQNLELFGLRIKAARILTNLNQEEFAEQHNFSKASVKNWELGRSIPRSETFSKIIEALNKCGVKANREWLLYGSGSGPTHIIEGETDSSKIEFGLDREIQAFEAWCKENRKQPLIIRISDDLMGPFFKAGDIVAAEAIDIKNYRRFTKKINEEIKTPFLMEISPGEYQPRYLIYNSSGTLKYLQNSKRESIQELTCHGMGRIIWIRKAPKY